jgi:hypothetical protein
VLDGITKLIMVCNVGKDFANEDTITVKGISYEGKGVETKASVNGKFDSSSTTTITDGSAEFKLVTTHDDNKAKVVRDNTDEIIIGRYEFKAKDSELTIDDITVTFTENISTFVDSKVEVFVDGERVGDAKASNDTKSIAAITSLSTKIDRNKTAVIEFKVDAKNTGEIEIEKVEVTTEETGITVAPVAAHGPNVSIVEALPVISQIDTNTKDKPANEKLRTADDVKLFMYKVKAKGGDVHIKDTKISVALNSVIVKADSLRLEVYGTDGLGSTAIKSLILNPAGDSAYTTGDKVFTLAMDTTVEKDETYYVALFGDVTVSDAGSIRIQMNDDPTGIRFAKVNEDGTIGAVDITGDKLLDEHMKALLSEN